MRKRKWQKRLIATVMSTVLLCQMPEIFAAEKQADMDAESITAVEEICGKKADVTISSVKEWNNFAEKVNNGNTYSGQLIKLTKDLQFDGTSNNVTLIDSIFNGIFDGDGHTISGLNIMSTSFYCHIGLFRTVGSDGAVKNLTVTNSHFDAKLQTNGGVVGGVIAQNNEGIIDNCHVGDVEINVEDKIYETVGYEFLYNNCSIAGIVETNKGMVINCSSSATIVWEVDPLLGRVLYEGCHVYMGGISASNSGRIYNSCNMGTIYGKLPVEDYSCYCAGIAANNGGTIENCYNVGEIGGAGIICWNKLEGVEGIIYNCYYEEGSISYEIMDDSGIVKNYTELSSGQMKSATFTGMLNKNRGSNTDWLKWEIRPEEKMLYPSQMKRISLSQCKIAIKNKKEIYDGTAKKPGVDITYGGKALKNSIDYVLHYKNNVNAGFAAVEVEGKGRYMGSTRLDFIIACADISKCNISLKTDSFVYNGKGKKPKVIVKKKGKTLKAGRDYKTSVLNNVNPGKGQVIITGKGNYQGKVIKKFTIQKAGQVLSGKSTYKKVWGDKPFSLNVKCLQRNGILKYVSSDKKVAAVNKKGKVTIKGTGKAVITVSVQGNNKYKGKNKKIIVNVAPKKQQVTTKVLGKQKISVKWKKDTRATGYQIQCSLDSKFKKNVMSFVEKKKKTTAKVIGKLKRGKTYYIRVRSYKAIKGSLNEVYGSWSKKKICNIGK